MKLSRFTVMLDACILYSAPLRDLLIELAVGDLFRAKWSADIEEEWLHAVLRDRPDLEEAALRLTCSRMRSAVLDCFVTGHQALVAALDLPDKNDRHVLAAAIHGKCDAILTFNLSDFPVDIVGLYDIEVLHPDDFLHFQFGLSDESVISAVRRVRARLTRPPVGARAYLDKLATLGLPKIVGELRRYEAIL